MILSIDFGGAVAKVLIVDGDKFNIVEVPLGFRTRPHLTVPETLRYIIRQAVGDREPEAVYASGEIASMELKEILTEPPLDPVGALKKLGLPAVVVGAGIIYVNGEAVRRVDVGECAEEIAYFLPFAAKISEIQNYFANKELYPQTFPMTPEEVHLEQAAARVRIQKVVRREEGGADDYVIASGGVFSKAPEPGQPVLMLLDSLQPEGLYRIFLDQHQLLPVLATLAFYKKEEAQKILDQEPFTFLGTTFSAGGEMFLSIDLGLDEPQELEVASGELVAFPLEFSKVAKVRFEGRGRKGEFEAEGGLVGLVVDTRGRPLTLPKGESERIRVLKKWEEAVCFARLFKK